MMSGSAARLSGAVVMAGFQSIEPGLLIQNGVPAAQEKSTLEDLHVWARV